MSRKLSATAAASALLVLSSAATSADAWTLPSCLHPGDSSSSPRVATSPAASAPRAAGQMPNCRAIVPSQGPAVVGVTVAGRRKASDNAVPKVAAKGLPTVTLGDPRGVQVGDWVLAIGAPCGFEQTATPGIVSAKGRSCPASRRALGGAARQPRRPADLRAGEPVVIER